MSLPTPDILLAEDSLTTAELFLFALAANKSSATIRVARDGVEVLEFLFCNEVTSTDIPRTMPRLLLLDIHMPRLGGFKVLERLRADERTRRLPVVMMSSSDLETDKREAYRLGANDYVQKPMGFTETCETVSRLERDWLK
jgi:CheY-like chemotaxis protein